jgi:hypothetical protein
MENEKATLARIGNIVAGLGNLPLCCTREDMITALRQIQLIVLTGEVRGAVGVRGAGEG